VNRYGAFEPQLKSPPEIRARHLALLAKAIKKSSPAGGFMNGDCISRRLISNCVINGSDKCVKTASAVIETRDAPLSQFTQPSHGRCVEGRVARVARADSLAFPLQKFRSNLFHFKVAAPSIGIGAKKSRRVRHAHVHARAPNSVRHVCPSRQVARHPPRRPHPSHPTPTRDDADAHVRGVAEVAGARASSGASAGGPSYRYSSIDVAPLPSKPSAR